MPITTVAVNDPITAVKINEIIGFINDNGISWINFHGSGPSIRELSGNIAGVVRQSAGKYRINFKVPYSSVNYALVATSSIALGNDTGFVTIIAQALTYADIEINHDDGGGGGDAAVINVIILGV